MSSQAAQSAGDEDDGRHKRLGAAELKRRPHDGGEIAPPDAREEGIFHARHLLLASRVLSPTFLFDGLVRPEISSGNKVSDWAAHLLAA